MPELVRGSLLQCGLVNSLVLRPAMEVPQVIPDDSRRVGHSPEPAVRVVCEIHQVI